MTYKTDDKGREYRVTAAYIDHWDGRHGHAGWCICEVRQSAEDGLLYIHRGEPTYANDCSPELRSMLSIYSQAAYALGMPR